MLCMKCIRERAISQFQTENHRQRRCIFIGQEVPVRVGQTTKTSPGHRLGKEPYILDIRTFRFEHAHATTIADMEGVVIMQAVAAVGQMFEVGWR